MTRLRNYRLGFVTAKLLLNQGMSWHDKKDGLLKKSRMVIQNNVDKTEKMRSSFKFTCLYI